MPQKMVSYSMCIVFTKILFTRWHPGAINMVGRIYPRGRTCPTLPYRFCSTRRYSVLVLLKSTCTRTCTQVLLKIKVLLTSTYEYFTSTNHLKLMQNSSQENHKSL